MNTKAPGILLTAALLMLIALLVSSCFYEDADPGPIPERTENYVISDFDWVEVGEAFDVTVEQGSTYSVTVKGDRRNIEDLDVRKIDGTLRIQFQKHERKDYRQYQTYITITMPGLGGINLTGAATGHISGFSSDFDMGTKLSGASQLDISGRAGDIDANLSGASNLHGFNFETKTATIEASGASYVEVSTTEKLDVKASGASKVRYRGNPVVNSNTSGASEVTAAN